VATASFSKILHGTFQKCVHSPEHEIDGEEILGLNVMEFIHKWAVLGEYIGVLKRNDHYSKSAYQVATGHINTTIAAESEGSLLRYVIANELTLMLYW
jgi:hypothetical protein